VLQHNTGNQQKLNTTTTTTTTTTTNAEADEDMPGDRTPLRSLLPSLLPLLLHATAVSQVLSSQDQA
jgi:hypothetical protein